MRGPLEGVQVLAGMGLVRVATALTLATKATILLPKLGGAGYKEAGLIQSGGDEPVNDRLYRLLVCDRSGGTEERVLIRCEASVDPASRAL